MIQVEEFDGAPQCDVLVGLIASTEVVSRLAPLIGKESFPSKAANLIAKWSVSYYNEYHEAIGGNVVKEIRKWAEGRDDKEAVQFMENLCAHLDGRYEQLKGEINPKYHVDLAREFFEREQLRKHHASVTADIARGEFTKAKERIVTFSPLEGEEDEMVDVFHDAGAVASALEYSHEDPVIEYDQGLKDFFGSVLKRANLVAVMGSDKSGKSYFLLDMAWRAAIARKRVAYFEAGDLTQDQFFERVVARAARRPVRPGKYSVPVEMMPKPQLAVRFREYEVPDSVSAKEGNRKMREVMEKEAKSFDHFFKFACVPNSTLKVEHVRAKLKPLERKGWKPDVIVIDYADIMADPTGSNEMNKVERIDETWKQLRALSQEQDCLVLTATQANAEAYRGGGLLSKKNFSGSKGKLAHVTAMFGINISPDDKEKGLVRLNWIERRDAAYNEARCCQVAGCLAISHPSVLSLY